MRVLILVTHIVVPSFFDRKKHHFRGDEQCVGKL